MRVAGAVAGGGRFGLHKILFYFEAYVHVSTIFFANSIFAWAPYFPLSTHTLLRNRLFPLDPFLLHYTPYNLVTDHRVKANGRYVSMGWYAPSPRHLRSL